MAEHSPLREYYAAQTPSASCVERLKALEASAEPEPLPPRRAWLKPLTAAALIGFILGVSLWSNSVVNPKPATESSPPPVDLAAPTPPPSENDSDAPSGNTAPPDPVESTEPDSLPADTDAPPEEGEAGTGSAGSFDPFWWLRMGGNSAAGLPGWGWQGSGNGSNPPGNESNPPVNETNPPGNGTGTAEIQPTYYAQDGRFYIRLSDREAVMQVYDMTDLLIDGTYSGPVQFRDKTVWVDLKIAEDGSVSLTVR